MTALLRITPPDCLTFEAGREHHQHQEIQLTNLTHSFLAFKVKTNSPTCFTVYPAAGVLSPAGEKHIRVTVLPADDVFDKPHKFLIQATPTDSEDCKAVQWNQGAVERGLLRVAFVASPVHQSHSAESWVPVHRQEPVMSYVDSLSLRKDELVGQLAETHQKADDLKRQIDKANHTLKFHVEPSEEELAGGYTLSRVAMAFVLGAVLGYCWLW